MKEQRTSQGITEEDWDDMKKMYAELDKRYKKETLYDKIKFEIGYKYGEMTGFFWGIKQGLKNFWDWKGIIWKNRWWDHVFLMNLIEKQLRYMDSEWHNSNHLHKDDEIKILKDLLKVLDEIEILDYTYELGTDEKKSQKYQEFGRLLFDVKEIEREETINGKQVKYKSKCSNIERLWD